MIFKTEIRHFKPEEFARPECLRWEMLKKLEDLREACGFPLAITSSFREPEHNAAVGGVKDSAHCLAPDGLYSGVDIYADFGGAGRFILLREIFRAGFNRIGIYPKHVHLDIEDRLIQQQVWVGKD
jgi:hypothetical protein